MLTFLLAAAVLTGPNAENAVPPGAHLRTDIDVPVLDVRTEGDMVALRAHLTHQPPFARYRRWEIAGAAHAETPRWVAEVPPPLDMGQACKDPVNSAPNHAVVKAALSALTRWVREGVVPSQSPAIELGDPASPDPIVRDRFGDAKGGIRLPQVEVRRRRSMATRTRARRTRRPAPLATSAFSLDGRSCSTHRP